MKSRRIYENELPVESTEASLPLMISIKGKPSELDDLRKQAAGFVNIPYVDFLGWVESMVPLVERGLDPCAIELAAEQALTRGGLSSPREAIRDTYYYKRMSKDMPPGSEGFIFPPFVTDPNMTVEQRCAAFIAMVEQCRQNIVGLDHEPRGGAPRQTEFSLQKILPVPMAEMVPTWYGYTDPHRRAVKQWTGEDGGIDNAIVLRPAPDELVVLGMINNGAIERTGPFNEGLVIAKKFAAEVEITTWGYVRNWVPDGRYYERCSFAEKFTQNAAAKVGVYSVDHLAALLADGHHSLGLQALSQIRQSILFPSLNELSERTKERQAAGGHGMRF